MVANSFRRNAFAPQVLLLLFITGCSHQQLTLYPRQESEGGTGSAREANKSVSINLHNKTYKGNYVMGGTTLVGFSSGVRPLSNDTLIGVGQGSSGHILAIADDGDTVKCDFDYSGGNGIGVCQDREGTIYDLKIK